MAGDDRSSYYNKWEAVARTAVEAVEAETAVERQEAESALGLDRAARSEAEAKDAEARVALKEAKKRWTEREKQEEAAKYVIEGRLDETFEVTPAEVGASRRVLVLARCERCRVTLPASLAGLIKLYVEDCADLRLRLECRLVTSFADVARSRRVSLEIATVLHTVQCDLSEEVGFAWVAGDLWDAAAPEGPKVYHAGCARLTVDAGSGRLETFDDYRLRVANPDARPEEQQFVTHTLDGALATERIVDSTNLVGATEREVDAERAERAAADRADAQRVQGNDCFKKAEYAQAAVHYTLALDALAGQPRAVVLANRSACFLKLGEPDKALRDADDAATLDPRYCKALFRKGLALHALHRYKDALPVLALARDLEPKNKQILDAMRFAEMRLARGPGPLTDAS